MAEIGVEQLARALSLYEVSAALWAPAFNAAMQRYDITGPKRVPMFLAQVDHETSHLMYLVENLNYSAQRLRAVFSSHFPSDNVAATYAGQPERIASRVYANRGGNGPETSGDGWRYRGRGALQLTFRNNYRDAGLELGLPLLEEPERLTEPMVAVLTAAWYWRRRGCNEAADAGDFVDVTQRIHGSVSDIKARNEALDHVRRTFAR